MKYNNVQLNAIKRIINSASRSALEGIFTDKNGRACACDGYRAIRLNTRPEELPTAPGLDIGKFFDPESIGYDLLLPTVNELNAIIKQDNERKNKLSRYDFGEDLPLVNARYLRDILRIFPDAICYRNTHGKNHPLYFTSRFGDALLMPIRK